MSMIKFDITHEGDIDRFIEVVTSDGRVTHATTYPGDGEEEVPPRLVFFWTDPRFPEATPLIGASRERKRINSETMTWSGVSVELVSALAREFLRTVEYPKAPFTDGSVGKGWRLTNSSGFQEKGCYYVELAVEPAWMVYGK